jgi:hypothetical protein
VFDGLIYLVCEGVGDTYLVRDCGIHALCTWLFGRVCGCWIYILLRGMLYVSAVDCYLGLLSGLLWFVYLLVRFVRNGWIPISCV